MVSGAEPLSLSLLMLGSLADNASHHLALTVASDDEAAVFADRLNGGADFHCEVGWNVAG